MISVGPHYKVEQ